jgi:hypothetical protein
MQEILQKYFQIDQYSKLEFLKVLICSSLCGLRVLFYAKGRMQRLRLRSITTVPNRVELKINP